MCFSYLIFFLLAALCVSYIWRFLSVGRILVFSLSPSGTMIKQAFVSPHFILQIFLTSLLLFLFPCYYAFFCIISSELYSAPQTLFSCICSAIQAFYWALNLNLWFLGVFVCLFLGFVFFKYWPSEFSQSLTHFSLWLHFYFLKHISYFNFYFSVQIFMVLAPLFVDIAYNSLFPWMFYCIPSLRLP